MSKNKTKKKPSEIYLSDAFQKFLTYVTYFALTTLVVFSVYKIFNWDRIFGKEAAPQVEQQIERNINLPPIVKNFSLDATSTGSSSSGFSYGQKIFLEDLIDNLKSQKVEVLQIEESNNPIDVNLLTRDGYKILINLNTPEKLLNDNIVSVYMSPEFKKDLTKEGGIKNLEYIDFRFKDKVFYRFKNYKKELATTTPVLITPKPTSSPAVTTVTSGSQTASTSATSTQ